MLFNLVFYTLTKVVYLKRVAGYKSYKHSIIKNVLQNSTDFLKYKMNTSNLLTTDVGQFV